jgi:hypothetical protein
MLGPALHNLFKGDQVIDHRIASASPHSHFAAT